MLRRSLALLLAWVAAASARAEGGSAAAEQRDALAAILHFWADRAPDPEDGGFNTFFDATGNPTGRRDKFLVMQARLVWLFASAHRAGWRDRDYEGLARRGADFLDRRMRDPVHDGYYECVGVDGSVLDDRKRTYAQGFALYGLAGLARATGDRAALAQADHVFHLLLARLRQPGSGYREYALRDWSPDPVRGGRTLDTHLHLVECFTELAHASGDPLHRAALREVADLLLRVDPDPSNGFRFDPFRDDWSFTPLPQGERTLYGHNAELAWLLDEAGAVLPDRRDAYRRYALALVEHTLAFGFDPERGGVALYGSPTGRVDLLAGWPPVHREKSWWPQAEALLAFSRAAEWTGAPRFRAAAAKQWDWIRERQIDPTAGEWRMTLGWDGAVIDAALGNERKTGYHNGRALLMLSGGATSPGADSLWRNPVRRSGRCACSQRAGPG